MNKLKGSLILLEEKPESRTKLSNLGKVAKKLRDEPASIRSVKVCVRL